MQSGKKQYPGGKYGKKRSGISIGTVLLIVCGVVLLTGGVLAMYVTSNRQRAEMESSQFHISSNYLEEESKNASYTVTDWGNGFDILLFNYEKENIAQISGVDMTYQVAVENASFSIKAQNGDAVPANEGKYTFAAAENTAYHMIRVTPDANTDVGIDGKTITVTVTTTAPYQKTLQAKFQIQRNSQPDYTVVDQGDGTVLVTVKTNDYANSVRVEWKPDKFSPDNTNVLMTNWKDENPSEAFSVRRDSTYELLFFKKTNEDYARQTGIGATITLE